MGERFRGFVYHGPLDMAPHARSRSFRAGRVHQFVIEPSGRSSKGIG